MRTKLHYFTLARCQPACLPVHVDIFDHSKCLVLSVPIFFLTPCECLICKQKKINKKIFFFFFDFLLSLCPIQYCRQSPRCNQIRVLPQQRGGAGGGAAEERRSERHPVRARLPAGLRRQQQGAYSVYHPLVFSSPTQEISVSRMNSIYWEEGKQSELFS